MNSPWGPPSSFYGSEYDQETLQNFTASHNVVNTPSILDPTRAALSYGLALPIAVSNESQQQLFVCQNQLIHLQQLVIREQRIIFEQEQRINSQQQLIQQQQQLLQPPSQSAPEPQWLSSPSVVPDSQHLSLDQLLPDFLTSPRSSTTDLFTAHCQLTATGEQLNIKVRFIHADADRLPFPAVVIGEMNLITLYSTRFSTLSVVAWLPQSAVEC
ncbi:hypothetical protein CF319_g8563 [Tilletia indica]|nr:hypothetical protein CF319_g8563 [Tilletia indica]